MDEPRRTARRRGKKRAAKLSTSGSIRWTTDAAADLSDPNRPYKRRLITSVPGEKREEE
jgi:hypothetical protein